MTPNDQMMSPKQLGEMLGMNTKALRYWRSRGEGPRYFKLSPNVVRYRRADVEAWLSNAITNTKSTTEEGK